MIRHPPIQTDAGIITHLQKATSEIYLDNQLLSEEGPSPAIPIKHNNDVFFSTSESSFWNCELVALSWVELNSMLMERSQFKSLETTLQFGFPEILHKAAGVTAFQGKNSNCYQQFMIHTQLQE